MSKALQAAKQHFAQQMTGVLQFMDVPEWGVDGKPLRIYYKPSMTLKQQEAVMRLNEVGKYGEGIAKSLITQALDVDGNRIFTNADMTEIMRHVSPDVTARIVSTIGGDDFDQEEIVKNSEGTTTLDS
jgi:hypothetical protein